MRKVVGISDANGSKGYASKRDLFDKLGTGLRPSKADDKWHMGHMWLFWEKGAGPHPPYRGYYPDGSDLPKRIWDNPSQLRRYLINNSVKGVYRVDKSACEIMEADPDQHTHREKTWSIDKIQKYLIETLCHIPTGVTEVEFGRYSCNEELTDCHNCSSWALWVINQVDENLVKCDRPKRLQQVERSIWGDHLNPSEKGD